LLIESVKLSKHFRGRKAHAQSPSIFFTILLSAKLLDGISPYWRAATPVASAPDDLWHGTFVATMRLKARSIDT